MFSYRLELPNYNELKLSMGGERSRCSGVIYNEGT